jgi:hypothetical protein
MKKNFFFFKLKIKLLKFNLKKIINNKNKLIKIIIGRKFLLEWKKNFFDN